MANKRLYLSTSMIDAAIFACKIYTGLPDRYITDINSHYSIIGMIIEALHIKVNTANNAEDVHSYLLDEWLFDSTKDSKIFTYVDECLKCIENALPELVSFMCEIETVEVVVVRYNTIVIQGDS